MGLSRLCCVTAYLSPVCTQIKAVKALIEIFLMSAFNVDVIRLNHTNRSLSSVDKIQVTPNYNI